MFEMLMEMLTRLEACGDVMVDTYGGQMHLTFCDFEGFDADWCEVMRDYEDEETVDAVFALLESCESEGDFYTTYFVDGREVVVGFTSYDI